MNTAPDHFYSANYRLRKLDYTEWHRLQSKRHILRSQLGFNETPTSRPKTCRGCIHYHGVAYGQSKKNRTVLICGFHPYGWLDDAPCPDWQPLEADG